MFKVVLLIALAIAGASAQEGSEQNAAPEPYSYAYQTDSSSASEQRSPDGRVTGFYTISDPTDGRERRVDYVADQDGFRAKVATNELGTKSENSANVEMLASPPTEGQLVYQAQAQRVYQAPQVQQQAYAVQQPTVTTTTTYKQRQQPGSSYSYVQQPSGAYGANYGYYPGGYGGYQMVSGTNPGVGYGGYQTVYGTNPGVGYGGYGANSASYNYHTPGQYYSNVQGARYTSYSGVAQPSSYTVGGSGQGTVSRYVSGGSVRTVPATGYSYSSGPVSTSTRTVTTSSGSSGNLGSGNLLVLKK